MSVTNFCQMFNQPLSDVVYKMRRPNYTVAMDKKSVCRALFGPTNKDENILFAREEIKRLQKNENERWNYDFVSDSPLEGRYTWEQHSPLLTCAIRKAIAAKTMSTNTTTTTTAATTTTTTTEKSKNIKLKQANITKFLKKKKSHTSPSSKKVTKVVDYSATSSSEDERMPAVASS